jgi:hypothetical protein
MQASNIVLQGFTDTGLPAEKHVLRCPVYGNLVYVTGLPLCSSGQLLVHLPWITFFNHQATVSDEDTS